MRLFHVLNALTLVLGGCSMFGYEHHTAVGYIELYPSENGGPPQIRVPYKITGRGNVHDPFSYSKWEFMSNDWITVDVSEGLSSLSGARLSPCPMGFNKWYTPKTVKGTIELRTTGVRIDLVVPTYDSQGGIKSWDPYEFNGEWSVVRPTNSPLHPSLPSTFTCEQSAL